MERWFIVYQPLAGHHVDLSDQEWFSRIDESDDSVWGPFLTKDAALAAREATAEFVGSGQFVVASSNETFAGQGERCLRIHILSMADQIDLLAAAKR